jgi:surfactin synthase thioesterase subunit
MTTVTYDQTWLRRFHEAPGDATRLVCLPHAGGSASFYFPFSAALTPAVQVLAVQYPGRQDRRGEPCMGTVPELAATIFAALAGMPDLDEIALFGHSMGAVLAFEVAGLLERRLGISPARLFVSGRRAPSRVRPENVHTRGDAELLDELRQLGGTNAELMADAELRNLLLPMIRADYRAVETYRCQPSAAVACPITVLTGDTDPRTTAAEAWDWRRHTRAACAVRTFVGGHFFIQDHQQAIVELVTRELACRSA